MLHRPAPTRIETLKTKIHSVQTAPIDKPASVFTITPIGSCSRDPIGYAGSRWNLFEYVRARVLKMLDRSGLASPWGPRPSHQKVAPNRSFWRTSVFQPAFFRLPFKLPFEVSCLSKVVTKRRVKLMFAIAFRCDATVILVEHYVQNPVHAFDPPVASNRFRKLVDTGGAAA